MDDKFDEKLASRIREVFDNYEYPPADEGWMELRKKFPAEEKRDKIAWLWWSSAAAILLVFIGTGIWMNNKPAADTNVANKPVTKQQPVQQDTLLSKPNINQHQNNTDNIAQAPVKTTETGKVNSVGTVTDGTKNPLAPNNAIAYTPVTRKIQSSKSAGGINTAPGSTDPFTSTTGVNTPAQSNVTAAAKLPLKNNGVTANTIIADSPAAAVNNAASQPQIAKADVPVATDNVSPAVKQPAKTVYDLFNDDKLTAATKKNQQDNKEDKKVKFSVYAATYFNYAEGSKNQVNAGAGFTSDFRLSKNVKLSTGLALAQNTLSYDNSPPPSYNERGRNYANAVAPPILQDGLFSTISSVAEFKNYNANLVGLDVPINIKYEFNPDKSDTYISAGLSSGTFIDEKYTYRYSYRNNGFANAYATATQDQTITQNFNSFYFARMLNLSFGVGYPIGKSNRLIIEPFLKYPLAGLGAQDIHFGAGGVNLKFTFKSPKK
jgi:hypothetical protein